MLTVLRSKQVHVDFVLSARMCSNVFLLVPMTHDSSLALTTNVYQCSLTMRVLQIIVLCVSSALQMFNLYHLGPLGSVNMVQNGLNIKFDTWSFLSFAVHVYYDLGYFFSSYQYRKIAVCKMPSVDFFNCNNG